MKHLRKLTTAVLGAAFLAPCAVAQDADAPSQGDVADPSGFLQDQGR